MVNQELLQVAEHSQQACEILDLREIAQVPPVVIDPGGGVWVSKIQQVFFSNGEGCHCCLH